jgi:hypothetical protein
MILALEWRRNFWDQAVSDGRRAGFGRTSAAIVPIAVVVQVFTGKRKPRNFLNPWLRSVMTAMANKRFRRTKIGLGNDVVEDWKGRCGPEIEVIIEEFLERVGEEEIKVELARGIGGNSWNI